MIAQKQPNPAQPAAAARAGDRKPWKKKTPVEVVLDQINKLRDQVTQQEEELKQAKKQLLKLEEARKVLEAS
jgi:hypothetical protein